MSSLAYRQVVTPLDRTPSKTICWEKQAFPIKPTIPSAYIPWRKTTWQPVLRSFLLTHTLFALKEFESVIVIAVFTTLYRGLCCAAGDHWWDLNPSVEMGVIPDVVGNKPVNDRLQVPLCAVSTKGHTS
ncbi:hypothetical protein EV401DRAFT_697218 [Pisolithus croceorrhizus]|nr:hypothetical protein EV401DRAFT_697218 [Pisolithus croceorrhizus]